MERYYPTLPTLQACSLAQETNFVSTNTPSHTLDCPGHYSYVQVVYLLYILNEKDGHTISVIRILFSTNPHTLSKAGVHNLRHSRSS